MHPSLVTRPFGSLALAILLVAACSRNGDGDDSTAAQAPLDPQAAEPAIAAPDTGTADAIESPATSLLDQYGREAAGLAAALATRGDPDQLKSRAGGLIDLAADLVPAFVARQPHCAPYLEAALQVRDLWPELDHEAIERDYHHDGALPKVDNAGICYHMKDLITHPATVLVLLSQAEPDHVQAKAEIDEVIAHMGVVRGQL